MRLNHSVLFVRDAQRTARFYEETLGFRRIDRPTRRGDSAVFLLAPGSTNDHDLGVFSVGDGAGPSLSGRQTVGLYHLGWEVDTLGDLRQMGAKLSAAGALVGASDHGTTKSLYAKDPDGLEFELAWIIPHELVTDADRKAAESIGHLDLEAEIARFGEGTLGLSAGILADRSAAPS